MRHTMVVIAGAITTLLLGASSVHAMTHSSLTVSGFVPERQEISFETQATVATDSYASLSLGAIHLASNIVGEQRVTIESQRGLDYVLHATKNEEETTLSLNDLKMKNMKNQKIQLSRSEFVSESVSDTLTIQFSDT